MSPFLSVAAEAARIKMGEQFHTFEDFDRCLDSLAVMNGRAMSRYKTFADRCIRVCRFGRLTRAKHPNCDEEPGDENSHDDTTAAHHTEEANHWELQFEDEEWENEPRSHILQARTQQRNSFCTQAEVCMSSHCHRCQHIFSMF